MCLIKVSLGEIGKQYEMLTSVHLFTKVKLLSCCYICIVLY